MSFVYAGCIRKHMFKKQREEPGEIIMDEAKEIPKESNFRIIYSCRYCGAIIYKDVDANVFSNNFHSLEAGYNTVSPPFTVHICKNISPNFKYYGLCEFIGFEETPKQ